ncbi:MAG: hypothetical protein AB7U98_03030 [Candidatus Nitrosocosmicus sp.]
MQRIISSIEKLSSDLKTIVILTLIIGSDLRKYLEIRKIVGDEFKSSKQR